MPWGPSSGRTTPLPRNWPAIRRAILERDGHRCTAIRGDTGTRCDAPATDVDHIDAPNDHRPANLRALCGHHHRRRTSAQGGRARSQRRRPTPPKHPGLKT